jgi:hypothetical protein
MAASLTKLRSSEVEKQIVAQAYSPMKSSLSSAFGDVKPFASKIETL